MQRLIYEFVREKLLSTAQSLVNSSLMIDLFGLSCPCSLNFDKLFIILAEYIFKFAQPESPAEDNRMVIRHVDDRSLLFRQVLFIVDYIINLLIHEREQFVPVQV